ncbi:MAG: ATP-binding protein [Aliiglaciecola sp.]|uniref:ATP-binding protein n=1 Tax=Aliiglaciecola sp. TaxID=1872441 RepID=UPI003298491A
MKMTPKLFLILLSLITTMLVISLSLAQWSFKQGFLEFVSGIEQSRLEKISNDLLSQYTSSENSWKDVQRIGLDEFISNNKRFDSPPKFPPMHNRAAGERPRRVPPPHLQQQPNRQVGAPNSDEPWGEKVSGPPTGLFDVEGNLVTGEDHSANNQNSFSYPLYVNDIKVGELRSWPSIEGSSESASLFAQQQLIAFLIIGLVCAILAGLLSLLVSRKLLQPIKLIMQGVSQLSSGNYNVNLTTERKDELGELMENVSYLSQTLNKNRSAKNRLFADISHELRTPLTVLTGEIDLLKEGIRPFNLTNLLSLEQETERLNHLIDDLYQLSLSDVGALKYNLVYSNLSETVERSIQSVQLQAESKGLKITSHIQQNLSFKMDNRRIEQLCLNLLMNSIAYTEAPGQVDISLSVQQDQINLQLNDSKPSVNQNDCDKLFEPMFRVDSSRTSRESGAGLGLTISKNIAEAHQGHIKATPSSLGGLCIEVTFPLPRGEK